MLRNFIKKLLSILPQKNIIMFESIPNLSDNTKAVFDEMLKRNLNEKYKMIWLVRGKSDKLPKIDNVIYCDKDSSADKLRIIYYRAVAKALICCNEFLTKINDRQKAFYLTHGACVKSVRNYYNVPSGIDYVLIDGEATKQMMAYEFNTVPEKVEALGYPRNDVMTCKTADNHKFFPETDYEKIIVWYPTFRQHKNGSQNSSAYALPILHDENKAAQLNEIAKDNNTLIVLKPHFAQDVSKIKFCNFSNIRFIDDSFFEKYGITSYEFIASCDALITDYSSVYYDYLLCDKPIGLVWEDYESYKNAVNFAVDMDEIMKAGEKIYTLSDFEAFIKNLAFGNDTLKKERTEISAWANFSRDGKNAERVVNFITEKAML